MIHHSTDFPFSWKILHERPHLLLSVPITPSLRCEKVLKILATAVVHPYSFWIMGSNPGALSFLTWALNFAFLVLVATLTLMDSAPLVFIDLPIEGALRRATEFVHGGNSVAGSGSLPPTAAEEISSESPSQFPLGNLGSWASTSLSWRSHKLLFFHTLDILISLHWVRCVCCSDRNSPAYR